MGMPRDFCPVIESRAGTGSSELNGDGEYASRSQPIPLLFVRVI